MKRRWTTAERQRVAALYREGVPIQNIVQETGRSRQAIYAGMRKIKTRRPVRWTPERQGVLENWVTLSSLAQQWGVSRTALMKYRSRLKKERGDNP